MPPEIFQRFWEAFPIGLISGLLAGSFGIGGGVIAIPLCRYVLGVAPHVAIGSVLAFIVPTALVGLVNYVRSGKLIWPLALCSGFPAVLSTIAGSTASHHVHGSILMLLVCAIMFVSGADFSSGFAERLKVDPCLESKEQFKIDRPRFWQAAAIGTLVGFLSGLLGLGGGFLLVPCYCYFFRLSIKDAFGTSLVVVSMVALPGAIVHALYGHLDVWLVAPMLLGSLPGAWLGSFFSLKARDRVLKLVFGLILVLSSVYFAWAELSLK